MKKLVLYFLLLMAVPATAQSGLFGSHSDHHAPPTPPPPAEKHQPGPMIKAGKPAPPATRNNEGKGMNTKDYEEAVRIINNENFDESRLNMAKRIVAGNPMNSRQIAKICRLFAFDANRLDFAKYAYKHCVDPNKYFLLDDVFTFESSKEELYKYIDGQ